MEYITESVYCWSATIFEGVISFPSCPGALWFGNHLIVSYTASREIKINGTMDTESRLAREACTKLSTSLKYKEEDNLTSKVKVNISVFSSGSKRRWLAGYSRGCTSGCSLRST